MVNHVFVLALNDFNLELLQGIRDAERFRFHSLLRCTDLVRARVYPMNELLDRARRQLEAFPDEISGLLSFWDFPSSTMAPVLRQNFQLPGPGLEAVLRCEHKYWSRLLQQQVVPELVPSFCVVDPYHVDSLAAVELPVPFWLKPVRGHSSHLGFRIDNEQDFRHALAVIRRQLPRCAKPFNVLLAQAELPPEIAAVDGYHCIAEKILEAEALCTLEGYVYQGRPRVYGIVDSLRNGHFASLFRYHYPSSLPSQVQQRMIAAAEQVMTHIGYDNGPFNMEFFYDRHSDRLKLLEINARISKSHCPLFAMVEGRSHHEVAVYLAVGLEPEFPPGMGPYACAAKFMLRRFADARVVSIPEREDIRRLQQELPGTWICNNVQTGMRLSDLRDQDSYSYEYAVVFIGGHDAADLEKKWQACRAGLSYGFAT